MGKKINKEAIKVQLDSGLYENYLNGKLNQKQLAIKLGISTDILRDVFRKFGYLTKFSHDQNNIKHYFFDEIKTEEQAYVIGFYLADGYLDEKNHRVVFNVNEKDMELIEKIRDIISPQIPISHVKPRINKEGYKSKPLVKLQINSKDITNDLIRYGIGSRKTYNDKIDLSFIPNKLMIHFIRGYFDGDGTVYFKRVEKMVRGKKYITELCNWSIISHSCSHLKQIQKFLLNEYNIKCNIIDDKKGNNLIMINKKDDFMRMRDVLYNNSNIFLKRKKDKYDNIQFINKPLKRKVKLDIEGKNIIFGTIKECAKYLNVSGTSIRNWISTPNKSKYKLSFC